MEKDPSIRKLIHDFLNLKACLFGPPRACGVYGVFVFKKYLSTPKETLLYIGSSKNVRDRVMNLRHPYRKCFTRLSGEDVWVYTKTLETEDYIEKEKILIRHLRPILNKMNK
jgi:predicted GIY-YIG superfamily endonuclease